MRTTLIALLLATSVGAPSAARAGKGYWHTEAGAGLSSCGTWTEARKDRSGDGIRRYAEWVFGFLSGVAIGSADSYFLEAKPAFVPFDPLNGTDADGVLGWIDNYCKAHPLKSISNATSAFVLAHPR